jgi:hypothetical protein
MRRAALFAVCFALASTRLAHAAVPCPWTTSFDPLLVGNSSGANMNNAYRVIVRDCANVPIAGKDVTIQLLTSSVRFCAVQDSGTVVDCAHQMLKRDAGRDADAVFFVRLAAYDNGEAAEVRAGGVLLGRIPVRSTDLNGDGATDLRDLNAFRERFAMDRAAPETDFNADGVTNGYDFALFRAEFMRGAANTVCP